MSACDTDDVAGVVNIEEYTGIAQSLNVAGANGVVDVRLDEVENDFEVSVEVAGLDGGIVHVQHMHADAACPTMADDANGDGYVDVVEGLDSYGGILMPLDSDLTDQAAGAYPTADGSGLVDYRESNAFDAVVESLRPEDEDSFVELDGTLRPATRTVVIHGVAPSTDLPSTVQTLEGLSPQTTLPVACVELERAPVTID